MSTLTKLPPIGHQRERECEEAAGKPEGRQHRCLTEKSGGEAEGFVVDDRADNDADEKDDSVELTAGHTDHSGAGAPAAEHETDAKDEPPGDLGAV